MTPEPKSRLELEWTGEELEELDDEQLEQLLAQTDELISDGTYDLQQVDLFQPKQKSQTKKDTKMTRAQKIQKKVGQDIGSESSQTHKRSSGGDKQVQKFLKGKVEVLLKR